MLETYRFTGQTVRLDCGIGPHAPVSVTQFGGMNDNGAYAAFLNTSSTGPAAVVLTTGNAANGAQAAFPVDGTPQASFVLPASMQWPITVAVPGYPFWVSAVGQNAGTTTILVTPCGAQT